MTFNESEASDFPSPKWFSKISQSGSSDEEEISKESVGFTTENLEETRSLYDKNSDTIRTEIRNGICSTCLFTVEKNNAAQCIFGDLICRNCAKSILKRSICRSHVESRIATKEETVVMLGIVAGLDLRTMKKASGLSEGEIKFLKGNLIKKCLVTPSGFGFFGKKSRLTTDASQFFQTLLTTYIDDLDFAYYAKTLGFYKYVETGEAKQ